MKERIVIEKEVLEKIIKASPIQWFDNKEKGKLVIFGKEYQTEKEPITWEELEKLVIDNCNNYTISFDGNKKRYSIEYKGLVFYNFGVVEFSIATKTIDGDSVKFNRCFATDMQPAQMWQIIKGLIGE